MSAQSPKPKEPCSLFSIVQYECAPSAGKITCWPLERIFRQYVHFTNTWNITDFRCGEGKPAIEVTNHAKIVNGDVVVDQSFV